ncbi:MAG: hypothetical protein L6V95_11730 [Candidatus Melainabacteria bacterium]|nr:MAG: hypothetical protein L6V95_11730 [Candidatus Melainabacteria bacterium]
MGEKISQRLEDKKAKIVYEFSGTSKNKGLMIGIIAGVVVLVIVLILVIVLVAGGNNGGNGEGGEKIKKKLS